MGLEVDFTYHLKSPKDYITWSGSNIRQTEKFIKKITNDIFFALKVKKSKSNEQLKQCAITYNYFSSITSKDDENLNQISIASRVDNTVGNVSRDLVDVINDVLNEEPGNNTRDSKDDDIQMYVNDFLKNLEYLKNSNGVNNINYDIDNQILQLMKSDEHDNVTKKVPDVDDDYHDSSDNEYWTPGDGARRIYKGENTKVRYFPFMASIHIFQNFQCGGSIIESDLVITAASCLQLAYNNRFFRENFAFLSVRIGSNYYVGGGETIPVVEVYFHPFYDPKSLNHNVAIMRLDRHIKFKKGNSRVMKIDIDRSAHRLPKSGIKRGVTVIGWGAKGVSNVLRDPWTNRLSFAVLGVYYLKDCQDVYTKQYVTRNHFCVGYISKGAGACSGDVGGPGIIGDKLAGIISFGSPRCGTPDAPTVLTKVGYYADWIDDIIEQEIPIRSRMTTTLTPFTVPPNRKRTTFVMKPIFDKDFLPDIIHQAEPQPFHALRIGTNKPEITHPKNDDLEIEEVDLFKKFLAILSKSNEVNDYKNLLETGNEAKRDHDVVGASIPDEGDTLAEGDPTSAEGNTSADDENLDIGDNLGQDRDILKNNILQLIEYLDISSEKQIDEFLAQVSDESLSQETFKKDKNPRKTDKLKSSWTDKETVNNVDNNMHNAPVVNEEFFEINDLTGKY